MANEGPLLASIASPFVFDNDNADLIVGRHRERDGQSRIFRATPFGIGDLASPVLPIRLVFGIQAIPVMPASRKVVDE